MPINAIAALRHASTRQAVRDAPMLLCHLMPALPTWWRLHRSLAAQRAAQRGAQRQAASHPPVDIAHAAGVGQHAGMARARVPTPTCEGKSSILKCIMQRKGTGTLATCSSAASATAIEALSRPASLSPPVLKEAGQ